MKKKGHMKKHIYLKYVLVFILISSLIDVIFYFVELYDNSNISRTILRFNVSNISYISYKVIMSLLIIFFLFKKSIIKRRK